ncbi:hypothetical protein ACFVWN_29090, partial [Nocardiopsis flavescens]
GPAAPADPTAGGSGAPASPAGPAPLEAADGTDLDACADADCEVLVSAGDEFAMDGSHGVDLFVFEAVGGGGVSFRGEGPGTRMSGRLPGPDASFVMNGFTVAVVAVEGSEAVVEFSP